MNNPDLIKAFKAGAVIEPYRIIKFDSDDDHVIQAAAVGDGLIGVSGKLKAEAAEDVTDITLTGVAKVEYGGSVTRGGLLTTDANGKAVAAAPASGVNNSVIGRAMVSGADGDIGSVLLMPSQIQGA